MPENYEKIASFRLNIENIDCQIHDLIIKRAELVEKIRANKKQNNLSLMFPERERKLLEARLNHHTGSFPKAQLLTIFRMIIAGGVAIQDANFTIFYRQGSDAETLILSSAKEFFGQALVCQAVKNTAQIARKIAQGNLAGVLLLEATSNNNWWQHLIDNPGLKVFGSLPFARQSKSPNTSSSDNPAANRENHEVAYMCTKLDNAQLPKGEWLVAAQHKPSKQAKLLGELNKHKKLWRTAKLDSDPAQEKEDNIFGCIPPQFSL